MVLHKAEGVEMENAMKVVAKRTQATVHDQLSAQVCGFGLVVGSRHQQFRYQTSTTTSKYGPLLL